MEGLPDVLFVIDVGHEKIAVAEAVKLGIPVVGIVDTNHTPDGVDYVIPGNDDAIRAIQLYVNGAADAVLEGRVAAQLSVPGVDELQSEVPLEAEPVVAEDDQAQARAGQAATEEGEAPVEAEQAATEEGELAVAEQAEVPISDELAAAGTSPDPATEVQAPEPEPELGPAAAAEAEPEPTPDKQLAKAEPIQQTPTKTDTTAEEVSPQAKESGDPVAK